MKMVHVILSVLALPLLVGCMATMEPRERMGYQEEESVGSYPVELVTEAVSFVVPKELVDPVIYMIRIPDDFYDQIGNFEFASYEDGTPITLSRKSFRTRYRVRGEQFERRGSAAVEDLGLGVYAWKILLDRSLAIDSVRILSADGKKRVDVKVDPAKAVPVNLAIQAEIIGVFPEVSVNNVTVDGVEYITRFTSPDDYRAALRVLPNENYWDKLGQCGALAPSTTDAAFIKMVAAGGPTTPWGALGSVMYVAGKAKKLSCANGMQMQIMQRL